MDWDPSVMPDLEGTRAIVTGAAGLGYFTALELLAHGAEVVLAARNPEKAAQAAETLAESSGRDRPAVLELDLADLTSVRNAAERVLSAYDRIDLLVNNAGVMATPERKTADGFELQVGTNHLGHFAFIGLLLPVLRTARVVTVSSFAHKLARGIGLGDLRGAGIYHKWDAYGKSKLANLLFMYELDRRARFAGLDLVSAGAHPGYAATELQYSGPRLGGTGIEQRFIGGITRLVAQPAAAGAWPTLYAATAPDVTGGSFYGPKVFGVRGAPTKAGSTRIARDPERARLLWSWSVDATGVEFL